VVEAQPCVVQKARSGVRQVEGGKALGEVVCGRRSSGYACEVRLLVARCVKSCLMRWWGGIRKQCRFNARRHGRVQVRRRKGKMR